VGGGGVVGIKFRPKGFNEERGVEIFLISPQILFYHKLKMSLNTH